MIVEFPGHIHLLLISILIIKPFKCFSEKIYCYIIRCMEGGGEICLLSSRVCVLFAVVVLEFEDTVDSKIQENRCKQKL